MDSLKQMAKKVTPERVKDVYRRAMSIKERTVAFGYDRRRFLKHHARRVGNRAERAQLEGRLVFHAHALEKGLSHQVVRLGFGKSALNALAKNMEAYVKHGYPKSSKAYINSLSVVKAYIEIHEKERFDVAYLKDIFSVDLLEEAKKDTSDLGGISTVNLSDKRGNDKANFMELFNNRWSIREYSTEPVNISKIDKVLEIARKTPSICNRQSSRATVIYDKSKIAAALKLQGGITGYELPPALIMITTDTSAFLDVNERNQVFIDGGLYSMAILMGLEYVSLAACPLNAMLSVKNDNKMRNILNIPASENIIMFISVGNFLEENKVPRSFRYGKDAVIRSI